LRVGFGLRACLIAGLEVFLFLVRGFWLERAILAVAFAGAALCRGADFGAFWAEVVRSSCLAAACFACDFAGLRRAFCASACWADNMKIRTSERDIIFDCVSANIS